ncbi:MAG: hypothetical protein N3B18_04075 [Desulfobacterota bacterium]|nr:hypothetical protein [Thermodesulfobacteriota bacterium]
MQKTTMTVHFDLDHEVDRRVYAALVHLPEYYQEPDLSRAVIRFIDELVTAIGECEERSMHCQALLAGLLGGQEAASKAWQ